MRVTPPHIPSLKRVVALVSREAERDGRQLNFGLKPIHALREKFLLEGVVDRYESMMNDDDELVLNKSSSFWGRISTQNPVWILASKPYTSFFKNVWMMWVEWISTRILKRRRRFSRERKWISEIRWWIPAQIHTLFFF